MKLISLNTWGGNYFEHLIQFIKQHTLDTNIFCFQEMQDTQSNVKQYGSIRANLLWEIKQVLPNFQASYFPVLEGFDYEANPVDFDLDSGQAIFIKNEVKVTASKNFFISGDKKLKNLKKDFSNLPTPLQYISLNFNGKDLTIFNFHGSPMPSDKLDSEKRLIEARKTIEIISKKKGAKILVGDFNLLPQTQCIKIYESFLKNLIKEFNIEKTRSKLSPFYGKPDFQAFADFTFISDEIKVKNFEVPDVEISDHLPMILEFY